MKRLLLLAVLVLMVAAPVAGLSLTFQDSGEFSSYITSKCIGGGCPTGSVVWTESRNGGNSYITVTLPNNPNARLYMVNTDPSITTYAAATLLTKSATGRISIALLNSGGSILYEYTQTPGTVGRYEVFVVGGTATVYRNGIRVGTSTPLAQNPSYVGFGDYIGAGTGSTGTWDDLVYGTTENRYIFGSPEQGYFIKKDIVNPAASGFCFPNGTIISSYNMTTTWGVGDSNASQTVQLKDYAGSVYATYDTPAGSQAGSIAWPLQEAIFNSGAPYGYYVTTISGSGEYSEVIPYLGSGATVGFNQDSYSRGDTATVSYSVDAGYWDTGTYAYRLDTMTIFGDVIDTQVVTTQTGSKSFAFSTSDTLGVYYAVLIRTPIAGGDDAWLWADSAELTGFMVFTGNVYDAETAAYIPIANVSITQGTTAYNKVTSADGNYTTDAAFYSGMTTNINITTSGYWQYTDSFTPLEAKTVGLNFTLLSLTPSHTGLAVGGIVRDTVYGRPIPLPTVAATNATHAESYSVTGNSVGYYEIDEDDGAFLTPNRCYTITGSKTGYGSQSYLKCVVST